MHDAKSKTKCFDFSFQFHTLEKLVKLRQLGTNMQAISAENIELDHKVSIFSV